MKKIYALRCLAIFALLLSSQTVWAEGTVDLVRTSSGNASCPDGDCNWPFLAYTDSNNELKGGQLLKTILWLYAENGEVINVASSVMEHADGTNVANIILVAPDGTQYDARSAGLTGDQGQINNRTEMDNGPFPGAGGYNPWAITVGAGQTGVWSVQFLPGDTTTNSRRISGGNSPASSAGAQPITWNFNSATDEDGTTFNMIAFDATVTSGGTPISGRLFTTKFATMMAGGNRGFCGDFFSLSCDGIVFQTDMNGVDIFGGTFFSDNKGHKLADDRRSYSSVDEDDYNGVTPTLNYLPLNTLLDVTNYLFFNEPDINMPEQTVAWNPNLTTPATQNVRLLRPPLANRPQISSGSFDSYDTCMVFTIDKDLCEGLITIDIDGNGSFEDPIDRSMLFDPEFGTNCIPWDFIDGQGNTVTVGPCQVFDIKFEMFIGEVHFPYADAENAPYGTAIEHLNGPLMGNDTMYYFDNGRTNTTPQNARDGRSSPSYSFTGGSGDRDLVDFWAYVPSVTYTKAGSFLCFDMDGDGIDDNVDIDDDNDGIPDIVEAYNGDDNGDGIPNYEDTTFCSQFDGISDGSITWDCSVNGLPDPSGDIDGDGEPNFSDPDFPGCGGIINGVCSNFDADGDGIPNHFDLDADDDGIPDLIEQGGVDTNGDGRVDDNTDSDGDGLVDIYDNDNTDGPDGSAPCTTQPYCLQTNSTSSLQDSNADGTTDREVDTDGDGIENYLDLDSDNDGIPDIVEAGGTDANGDGRADNYVDNDGDGFNDLLDGINCADVRERGAFLSGSSSGVTNGDDATIPDGDFADVTTSGDIVIDFGTTYPADTELRIVWKNGGTTSNVVVAESADNTTYTTITTASIGSATSTRDIYTLTAAARYIQLSPASGTADEFGVDAVELVAEVCNNGTPLITSQDSGSDGIADSYTGGDQDGDGIMNHLDLDSDNDGIPDVVEAFGVDTDGDGIYDGAELIVSGSNDTDNDGFVDIVDGSINPGNGLIQTGPDEDFDGRPDNYLTGDTDGDGIQNYLDLDADNDGIADVIEAGGADSNGDGILDVYTTGTPDTDNNGLADVLDESFPSGSPLALIKTNGDGNSDGIADSYPEGDSDGDGILDMLDLDSDNDGIADVIEAGGVDTDGDGFLDGAELIASGSNDTDNDGFVDLVDGSIGGSTALIVTSGTAANGRPVSDNAIDTDSDGIIDRLDLDSDNDGIPDVVETGGVDTDGDGVFDGADVAANDADRDGFIDVVDGDTNNDGTADNTAQALVTTAGETGTPDGRPDGPMQAGNLDGDSRPNHLDLDSDNDGIADVIEAGGEDTDGNGIHDAYDNSLGDADNDGFADQIDGNDGSTTDPTRALILTLADGNTDGRPDGYANGDTDGDTHLDFLDLDADNDGIADVVEAGGVDTDGDGVHDGYGAGTPDSDNDGLLDLFDADVSTGTNPNGTALITTSAATNGKATADNSIDTDGDNVPDRLDLDSDNDGIADVSEAGGTDTDGDGRHDGAVTDTDNDGFADLVDADVTAGTNGTALITTPSDGTTVDGRPDSPITGVDFDGDGISNHLDLDSDNDGIADVVEAGGVDNDGDGVYDGSATDVDGDGFADAVDGNIETPTPDVDAARALVRATADDGSGRANGYDAGDADGDGHQNYLDLDADNDGIADVVEAGGLDNDGDGVFDDAGTDTDNNGWGDNVDGNITGKTALITTGTDSGNGRPATYTEGDTDGDDVPDFLDLDSDNDGIADVSEAGGTDTDGDGRHDGAVTDTDNDGFADLVDADVTAGTNGTALITTTTDSDSDGRPDNPSTDADFDLDGIPNHLDLDSDNDGIADVVEAGGVDTGGDGVYDGFATDTDGDGFADAVDGNIETPTPDLDAARALVRATADDGSGRANGYDAGDADGDGHQNYLDLDADNDGIADVVEAGGVDTDGNGVLDTYATTADADNDGFADEVDASVPSGIAGTALITTGADSGNGRPASYNEGDTDGEGVLDLLDLDSDNDGIADVSEAGGTDTNGDGIHDDFANDADNDGFADLVDGSVAGSTALIRTTADGSGNGRPDNPSTDADFDGDGISNHLDLDSDNDGIPDVVEANGIDENGDGRFDGAELAANDTDADGFIDVVDGSENPGNALIETGTDGSTADGRPESYPNGDADGDGLYNFWDLDADDDGIPDAIEAGGTDADNDGVEDSYDVTTPDTDDDGFADALDGDVATATTPQDPTRALILTGPEGTTVDGRPGTYPNGNTDNGSIADIYYDFLDIDSDNDGITDLTEASGTFDADGRVNGTADGDGDGYKDTYDSDNGGTAIAKTDTDGDGIPNYLDIDSDDDAIPDYIEGVCTDCFGGMATNANRYQALDRTDANENGLWDVFEDLDGNNDGTTSGTNLGVTPVDTDSDGDPDYLDTDSDEDTYFDWTEGFDLNDNGVAYEDIRNQGFAFEVANPSGIYTSANNGDDGIVNWLDNQPNTNGQDETSRPPFLVVGNGFYLDANNNGLVDIFDPFVTGGVEAFTPNNTGGAADDDWRDVTAGIPLPIELTLFQAQPAGQTALLTWISETEINSSHYEVERSRDGVAFEYIGRVEAAGNSQTAQEYSFVDAQPYEGVNYYRLRMVDRDASFEYSAIRTVRFDELGDAISLFPNPANDELQVGLPAGLENNELQVEVTDVLGRTLIQTTWNIQGNLNEQLDVSNLAEGIYYLKMRTLTWQVVKPFRKQ